MTRYALYILMMLLIAGCTDNQEELSEQREPVSFGIELSSVLTRANTTLDNIWTPSMHIAICEGTTIYPYKPKTTSTASGATVELEPVTNALGSAYFWSVTSDASRTFSAWYPYTLDSDDKIVALSTPLTITVPADQTVYDNTDPEHPTGLNDAEYNSYDLLYAPAITLNYKEKNKCFNFYHQMCRVLVSINSMATANIVTQVKMGHTTENVGNIKVQGKITTLGTSGKDAPGTKTVWENVSGTSIINMRKIIDASANDYTATYECLLPPQSGGSYEKDLFTIKATSTKTGTKTYVYRAAFDLEAGFQYHYNLSLSKAGIITISTVTVSNWGTTDFISGDADVPPDYSE